MLKNPRFYLYALGGWLVLTNLGHTFGGIPEFLGQSADPSAPMFKTLAPMIADQRGGVFDYDVFDIFLLGMLGITLFLLLAAVNAFWIAKKANKETLSQFSLINLVFWGFALGASVFFHPVDNMVIITLGAFFLSALAFWRERAAA